MKKFYWILTLIVIATSALAKSPDTDDPILPSSHKGGKATNEKADSIMRFVIEKADVYQNAISRYEADIYIKGRTEILRQNILIRLAHHLFPLNRKNKDMIFEMLGHSIYEAPRNYEHDIYAVNGNSIPNEKKQKEVFAFLNMNVYSPTVYDDAIIMPIAHNAFKFYTFDLKEEETADGLTIYKISFLPKQWSQKLVCGYLYIIDQSWTIDKIDINGRYSFAEFNLIMSYGRDFRRFVLPEKADLFLSYRLLGNAVVTSYHTSFQYHTVEWVEEDYEGQNGNSLDLTNYNLLSSDTIPVIRDTAYWAKQRDLPLSPDETKLYQKALAPTPAQVDTTDEDNTYIQLTERLVNTYSMNLKSTRIRYSGILNPFQIGYSARNGITYKQQLRISIPLKHERQLRFRPEIGYVFKHKRIFFKLIGDWEYLPPREGTLSLEIANDNESYSSEITNKINEELKDSTFNFKDLNLKYFKHYYIELKHSIELFNGFQLTTGLSYHHRTPSKTQTAIDVGEEVSKIIQQDFNDFIPTIGFSYTPRQYYRMNGQRKEYAYSYYPTFAIEFAKAIPHVGNSQGNYSRIEADIHQSLAVGLSRRLNYHVSAGIYVQQKSTYFADFRYFARRNFPDSWDDQIGGVFNLLKSEWFNASNKYIQTHFMYESPFLLFKILRVKSTKKFMRMVSRYVFSERFYLSHLWTPALPSYTEIGYGIGNHIFNIGVFVGFDHLEYQRAGFKFAFELFK